MKQNMITFNQILQKREELPYTYNFSFVLIINAIDNIEDLRIFNDLFDHSNQNKN